MEIKAPAGYWSEGLTQATTKCIALKSCEASSRPHICSRQSDCHSPQHACLYAFVMPSGKYVDANTCEETGVALHHQEYGIWSWTHMRFTARDTHSLCSCCLAENDASHGCFGMSLRSREPVSLYSGIGHYLPESAVVFTLT